MKSEKYFRKTVKCDYCGKFFTEVVPNSVKICNKCLKEFQKLLKEDEM